MSYKYLTEHCGILDKLFPGDVVLADQGFNISDSVGIQQAQLHIPAFTKGKAQLSAFEVEQTRSIAHVRIHVERVIGCVRQKFSIFQSTLPIDLLIKRAGEECPLVVALLECAVLSAICAILLYLLISINQFLPNILLNLTLVNQFLCNNNRMQNAILCYTGRY